MHISSKCSAAIHCLIFIHEYEQTHKVTSTLLSLSTGVNAVTIRNFLSAMKKDGILMKTETGGVQLALSPSEISLYRIGKAIEPVFLDKLIGYHSNPSKTCPIGKNIYRVLEKPYGKIKDDLKNSLKNITLQDFLTEYDRLDQSRSSRIS